MRIRAAIAILFTALVAQAEPLDRIAVSIGNQVITESALILDLRVSAFMDRLPVDLSPAAKRRSAERLTDQLLILREATESHLTLPAAQDAKVLLNDLRTQYGPAQEYQAALKRYGIQESDVEAQLLSGLIGLTFTDLRFRPAVQISEEDLRAYYAKLTGEPSFEASRDKIEELLRRQRTSEALDQWLLTARAIAHVQFREQVFR
jgi:hypothetical protein